MNQTITFYHHKNLNKTLKEYDQQIRILSVSKKNNKESHHYLTDTVSSLNKKTIKYENTLHKSVNSNASNIQKSNTPPIYYRQRSNSQPHPFLSKSSYQWESNENIQFNDKLNHFSPNNDFGHDPFGHFS